MGNSKKFMTLSDDTVEITVDDRQLRRVVIDPNYIKDDGRVTSFAFRLRKDETGLSVDVERLTNYEAAVKDTQKYKLWALIAEVPRNLGLECIHDPVEDNNAHALIIGEIDRSVQRKLARSATPVNPDLPI